MKNADNYSEVILMSHGNSVGVERLLEGELPVERFCQIIWQKISPDRLIQLLLKVCQIGYKLQSMLMVIRLHIDINVDVDVDG
jgi:hypothetical protein